MSVADAPLADVLSVLSGSSGMHVSSESCGDIRVDLEVSNASAPAVASAIATQLAALVENTASGIILRCGT